MRFARCITSSSKTLCRLSHKPMKIPVVLYLAAALASAHATAQEPDPKPAQETATITDPASGHLYAEIETSKGLIEAELDFQKAPLTVMNFVGLAEGSLPFQNRPAGKPFFDGLTFHRVVKDFVVQGGDPFSADPATPADKLGEGGPGYSFPDEFSPALRHDAAGVLSMANDGPDTNGSQFFITLGEVNHLNYLHAVFGQVVRGLDVVNRIEPGDRIEHIILRRVGSSAEAFKVTAEAFADLQKSTIASRHPVAAADFVYLEERGGKLPDFRVKNFNYKLANYERATGHRLAVRINSEQTSIQALARSLGFTDGGDNVLLSCLLADKTWKAWLGEVTYPALLGEAGSTEQLMASGVMHEKKTALLARANAQLADDKLKESVDAAIDSTLVKLDDFSLKQPPPLRP